MKKFILVLIIFFAACGIGNEAYEERAVISLWFWEPAMEEAINRMYIMDLDVEHVLIPWEDYWSTLQTALLAGNGPDVFWMNQPGAVSYMPSGLVMELTDLKDNMLGHSLTAQFEPVQFEPFTFEGRLYGLPVFFDAIALFYNKELFDEAGLPHPPNRGWTKEEMRQAAKELTTVIRRETVQYGLGIHLSTQTGTANFILQNGGHMFTTDRRTLDLNNSGALEALQFMRKLIFEDRVSPLPWENVYGEYFVSGMLAMEIQGMWRVPLYYEFLGDRLGIAHLPVGGREANTFHSVAYMVSAQTANRSAVLTFLEYAVSSAHGDIIATVFLPAYRGSRQLYFDKFPGLNMRMFAEAMEFAEPLQLAAVNAGQVWDVLNREMERAFMENEAISPEILDEINYAVNSVIQRPYTE